MKRRIFSDCILVFSLFFLPWWATTIFTLGFLILFRHPWEVLVIGFFIDFLYRIPAPSFFSTHLFFLLASFLFVISYVLKEHFTFELY